MAVIVVVEEPLREAIDKLTIARQVDHLLQLVQVLPKSGEETVVGLRVEEFAPVHAIVVLGEDRLNLF